MLFFLPVEMHCKAVGDFMHPQLGSAWPLRYAEGIERGSLP